MKMKSRLLAVLIAAMALAAWGFSRHERARKVYFPIDAQAPQGILRIDGRALIDINTADEALLQELPGIGPELAQKIARYRAEHGAFASARDLLSVGGIGEAKLEAIRPRAGVDTISN